MLLTLLQSQAVSAANTILGAWSGNGLSAQALTTATAGTGDRAFDIVTGSPTVEVAGSRPARIRMPAGLHNVKWNSDTRNEYSLRFYYTPEVFGANPYYVGAELAGTPQWRLAQNPPRLRNGSGSTSSANIGTGLTVGTLYRFEVTATAGNVSVTIYQGHSNIVVGPTTTLAATSTDIDRVYFGAIVSATASGTYDDIAMGNAAQQIGPAIFGAEFVADTALGAAGATPTLGTAAWTADTSVSATATRTGQASSAFAATTSLSSAGARTAPGALAMTASSTMSTAGSAIRAGALALSATTTCNAYGLANPATGRPLLASWSGNGLSAHAPLITTDAGPGDTGFATVSNNGAQISVVASGLRSPRIQMQGGVANTYVEWKTGAGLGPTALSTYATRFYFQFASVSVQSWTIAAGATGNANQWRLDISGLGGGPPANLRLRNSANAVVTESTQSLSVDTLYRAEIVCNAGVTTVNVYFGETGILAVESLTGTTGGTNVDSLRFGHYNGFTSMPNMLYDDMAVANGASEIGPYQTVPFITGSTNLVADTTFTSAGAREVTGQLMLTATTALTLSGDRTATGPAAFTTTTTLAAEGSVVALTRADFLATTSFTSAAALTRTGAAALTTSTDLSISAARTAQANINWLATTALSPQGAVTAQGQLNLLASTTFTSQATLSRQGVLPLLADTTASINGTVTAATSASLTWTASTALNPVGEVVIGGAVALNATTALSVVGVRSLTGVLLLQATTQATVQSTAVRFAELLLNGTSSLIVGGYLETTGAVPLVASTSWQVEGVRSVLATANLLADSTMLLAGLLTRTGSLDLFADTTATLEGRREQFAEINWSLDTVLEAVGVRTAFQLSWSYWNGSVETPLILQGIWDGNAVQPVASVRVLGETP